MRFLTVCLSLIAMLQISSSGGLATVSDAEASKPVQISVAVLSFNCPDFTGHLLYKLRSGSATVDHHATALRSGAGEYLLTLSVKPGHYQLLLDSEIPDKDNPAYHSALCETQQWFTVLPNHERHLALVLGNIFIPHSECSIAGTLPVAGLAIELVLPKGHISAETVVGGQLGPAPLEVDYGAEIDGSAYYIEHVPVENFVLRFGGIEIPMDLTKLTNVNNPYCQGEFVHNITRQELQRAYPAAFATE